MLRKIAATVLIGALAASAVPVSSALSRPEQIFEERAVCNADNLLRLLRTPSNLPEALPFCSNYLNLPKQTVTIATFTAVSTAATITPVQTLVLTDTITRTFTSYEISTTTDISFSTITNVKTSIIISESTVVVTSTLAGNANTLKRRGPKSTALSSRVIASYDAAKISSACGCLTIPLEPTSVTATAPVRLVTLTVPTVTDTARTSITTDTTAITTETLIIATTQTFVTDIQTTITATSIITSTTTIAAPAAPSGYKLLVTSGPLINQYAKGFFGDIISTHVVVFTTSFAEATTFYFDDKGFYFLSTTAGYNKVYAYLDKINASASRPQYLKPSSYVDSCISSQGSSGCYYEPYYLDTASNLLIADTTFRSNVRLQGCNTIFGSALYTAANGVLGTNACSLLTLKAISPV